MKSEILLEISFQSLVNNTTRNFPTDRKASSQRVQLMTTMFIPSEGGLEIRAKTSTDNADYDSVAYFDKVDYTDNPNNQSVTFLAQDNTEYHIQAVRGNANVKVNCTCLDFHYRFALWNDKKQALHGQVPAPYIKKTDSKPQNPGKIPGVCKHLMKMFEHLKREGIIR